MNVLLVVRVVVNDVEVVVTQVVGHNDGNVVAVDNVADDAGRLSL